MTILDAVLHALSISFARRTGGFAMLKMMDVIPAPAAPSATVHQH